MQFIVFDRVDIQSQTCRCYVREKFCSIHPYAEIFVHNNGIYITDDDCPPTQKYFSP